METTHIPYIPENAPFTAEQRAWLNGFLAGLYSKVPPTGLEQSNPAPPKKGEPLLILFGSQTGTAENLAKRIAKDAEARGFSPSIFSLNDYDKAEFTKARHALIISSTWGDGEPPDNAANFWDWLKSDNAPRLESLEYSVLGLGDRNYADFCGASKKFDERLSQLGAKRLTPRAECDVEYETPAKTWSDEVWSKLVGRAAPRAPQNGHHAETVNPSPAYSKSNPFPARLLKNILLNKPGSAKEVRHVELSLADSGLTYTVGDALGVVPSNCPALVEQFLHAAKCSGDEIVEIAGAKMPFAEALQTKLDITRPSNDLLNAVAKSASNCEFAPLLAAEKTADLKKYMWGRDIVDVLGFLCAPIPAAELAAVLRKLAPRLYSISSSPKAHANEVHLTVGIVRYDAFGRKRKGVCSTYLAERCETAPVFVQPSHGFKPPTDNDRPMIMVGPGTGIAPFRAFLEEREAIGAKGKNWLFFGDQTRAGDFLYEGQLTHWTSSGLLTRLDLAFSRDQAEKIYVQHRMLENAAQLYAWLEEGAHFYVCGDASRMAADVDAALHKAIETAGAKSPDEARAYVAKLKSEKRYQRDVY